MTGCATEYRDNESARAKAEGKNLTRSSRLHHFSHLWRKRLIAHAFGGILKKQGVSGGLGVEGAVCVCVCVCVCV